MTLDCPAYDRVIEHGDPVQVQAAQQRVMLGEPASQRHRQIGQLPRGPHPADRQVRQHAAAALPFNRRPRQMDPESLTSTPRSG